MITGSYLISLVNECRSDIITCDDCKWNNYGKCRTEEVSTIVNKMLEKDLEQLSEEQKGILYKFLKRGK
jgi:hypothetical protein